MKKLFFLFPVIIVCFFIMTGQKSPDVPEKWDLALPTGIYDPGVLYSGPLPQSREYFNPNTETRNVSTPFEVLAVEPNVRLLPRTNSHQSEVIICRHPLNPLIMFGSSNAFNNVSGSLFISEGVYVTTNGGSNWFGSDTLNGTPISNHGGDPGPTIDKDGNFIMTHLGRSPSGIYANFSSNNGLTWSPNYTIISGSQDKNLTGTDDSPTSLYYGRSYTVWSLFTATSPPIDVSYTTNNGVSWSPPQQINTSVAGHYSQGCDIRVGPNGEVYVVWAAPISGTPFTEDFCGFAKSTNGGVTWTVTNNAFDMNGIRGTFASKAGIRVNSFPRIDVDRSGGARNGWIYVTTSGRNIAPAGSDPDILLHISTNGGTNWSSGTRVNQDALNNGKFQWFPAIRVDEAGGVNIVYYDDRNTSSDSGEVYISRSLDGGTTWSDILVSDHRFKPKPITVGGIAGGYQGDYIGITSGNSKLWPIWADDFTGIYQAWTSGVQIASYPLNPFNITSPAAGATLVSFPNSGTPVASLTWDTSASTASYKFIFGSPTISTRRLTIPSASNVLTLTSGQLDNLLAGIGLATGDSLVGQWDVWAFRNNITNDSLKSTNGPRAMTLKRGVPSLTTFNLLSPPSGTTITTSVFNSTPINFNWSRSGAGVTYKWKFGNPTLSNIRLSLPANNSGYDSTFTINNNTLDATLSGLGLNPGDSLVGQWAVWAYSGIDSVKSTQSFALTLKRQAKGDVVVVYDSTSTGCRVARDSIANNLGALGVTFDLYNRRGNTTGTASISYRGYKKVILLGEGTSVMSNVTKDSLKSYIASGTSAIKSKVIIMAEDIGWHLDRSTSTFIDTAFARGTLGFQFVLDRPASGANQGLIGVAINPGLADSTVGTFPEVIRKPDGIPSSESFRLYRFRSPDSTNSLGRITTTYNIAIIGTDVESMRRASDSPPASPVRRFLKGSLDFVDQIIVSVQPNQLSGIPTVYSLAQNYPNPFNPVTKIKFSIPKQGLVQLKIYDVLGKEVMSLVNEQKAIGNYEIVFNAGNLSSGAYFYRLEAGEFTDIKRMILIK